MKNGFPKKGDWIMAKMDVQPADGKLNFIVAGAPVATVIHSGQELRMTLDESQAAFWVMSFPMIGTPTTMDEFLEKLNGLRMSIEDKTRKIVTVPA